LELNRTAVKKAPSNWHAARLGPHHHGIIIMAP
jgi:hypothetical protein